MSVLRSDLNTLNTMKKGFSLVEIIVVIAIIGILAGILLVVFGPARTKGKDTKIESNMLQLQNLAERIYLDSGNYDRVDSALSPEIAAISDDLDRVRGKAGSLNIFKSPSPAAEYCAYSYLISSPLGFCVDSSGFVGKGSYPTQICYTKKICGFSSCPDINNNGVIDCSNDPNDPTNCPSGPVQYSDVWCLLQCHGANFTIDPPSVPANCGVSSPCWRCDTDQNGNGKRDECDVYDVTNDKIINITDVFRLTPPLLGQSCF